MVLTLAIPIRYFYGLEDFITHAASAIHGQDHAGDRPDGDLRLRDGVFMAWYSGNGFDKYARINRHVRALRSVLLGADRLQLPDPAAAVVQVAAYQRR